MSDQLPEVQVPVFRVRPADAYAALRVIADGARAAADVVLEQNVRPAAEASGASTFTTRFGKVFTATTEAKVEILTSAALREWLLANLDSLPDGDPPIIPEHQEDVFDERQMERAANILTQWYRDESQSDRVRTLKIARQVLRAAFPPRTVPSRIADWVIPYLLERAKVDDNGLVYDSQTGEVWPWATYVPEKVEWKARLSNEEKAAAATAILEHVTDMATMVGVKEIGQ